MVKKPIGFGRNPDVVDAGNKQEPGKNGPSKITEARYKAIEAAKKIIDGATTEKGRKEGLNELIKIEEELILGNEALELEIDKKKGILTTGVQAEIENLQGNFSELEKEYLSRHKKLDIFHAWRKGKNVISAGILGVVGFFGLQITDALYETKGEERTRLATETELKESSARVGRDIEDKMLEIGGKVDQPIEIDSTTFFRKNKTVALSERKISVDDYFYILEGNYHGYEVSLNFPNINSKNIIVKFGEEVTQLTNPGLEDLEKFLQRKFAAFELRKNQEAAEKAQKEAEELEKKRVVEQEKVAAEKAVVEKAAQEKAQAEQEAQEAEKKRLREAREAEEKAAREKADTETIEAQRIANEKAAADKIEADRIADINTRKEGVTNVIKELSENPEYELGDDFTIKVELADETVELYFAPERRLGNLRDDNQWEVKGETLKLYLDPIKSGIVGDTTSGLEKYASPTDKSHIEISVEPSHKMHVHLIYPGDKPSYEQQDFNTEDLRDFWRDIVLELQGESEVSERKEAKITENKKAILEVLRRLSGNANLELNESFDIVATNGEHEIQFSLEASKGNGSLPTDNHWGNLENSYILRGVDMKSETLNIHALEILSLSISLQEPYNISYISKKSGYKPQEETGYSSSDSSQLLEDIYGYFSLNAEVKENKQ